MDPRSFSGTRLFIGPVAMAARGPMKAYRISGEFRMGHETQPFTLETVAESEEEATEWTFSVLGSRHRAKRRQIDIHDVHAESLDEVEDAGVQFALEHEEEYKQRKEEEVHG